MVKLYFDLIRAGARTIEQVPTLWRADVQAMLDAQAVLDAQEASDAG